MSWGCKGLEKGGGFVGWAEDLGTGRGRACRDRQKGLGGLEEIWGRAPSLQAAPKQCPNTQRSLREASSLLISCGWRWVIRRKHGWGGAKEAWTSAL